jgi:hypothetical protein
LSTYDVGNVDYVQQYLGGKKNKRTHCSTCVAVADFVLDARFFTEVLPVECGAVDCGLATGSG